MNDHFPLRNFHPNEALSSTEGNQRTQNGCEMIKCLQKSVHATRCTAVAEMLPPIHGELVDSIQHAACSLRTSLGAIGGLLTLGLTLSSYISEVGGVMNSGRKGARRWAFSHVFFHFC
jgi:hypothetical protein